MLIGQKDVPKSSASVFHLCSEVRTGVNVSIGLLCSGKKATEILFQMRKWILIYWFFKTVMFVKSGKIPKLNVLFLNLLGFQSLSIDVKTSI